MERIKSEALVAMLALAGDRVIAAAWADEQSGDISASISVREIEEGIYGILEQYIGDIGGGWLAAHCGRYVLLEQYIGGSAVRLGYVSLEDALEEWVEELDNFDELPYVFGDTAAAEWCEGVLNGERPEAELSRWQSWFAKHVHDLSKPNRLSAPAEGGQKGEQK